MRRGGGGGGRRGETRGERGGVEKRDTTLQHLIKCYIVYHIQHFPCSSFSC